jgi:hypothetical protein
MAHVGKKRSISHRPIKIYTLHFFCLNKVYSGEFDMQKIYTF